MMNCAVSPRQKRNKELAEANDLLQRSFVDQAISDAMSGNFRRAEVSIGQAEVAGANPHLLSAVRGLARYFAGDVEQATEQLWQAARENPNSIEAWSVLFLATYDAGEYEFQGKCRQHLLQLEPKTDIERMLKAMTNVWANPNATLNEFNSLVEIQENSGILRVLRETALNAAAKIEKDGSLLKQSLDDFEWAISFMPDNRFCR